MAAKVISIEVGYSLTRVCEVDYKAKTHKVYRYFTIPTPKGIINDGVLTVTPEYIEALKSALAAHKMKSRQAVFSITSGRIVNREIVIPAVRENRIADVVKVQAADYFPVDLSQYQLAYSVLEKGSEAENVPQYKLLVWAAPSMLLDGYYDLAGALKLEVAAIDYAGNSVFQAVRDKRDGSVSLVIKAEECSTIVMVVDHGKLVLTRNIAHGVEEVTEAGPGSCVTMEALEPLIVGISRVVDYYISHNSGFSIEKVYVTGLGANLKGLPDLIEKGLICPVEVLWQVPGWNLEKNFKTQRYGEYIACVGAAACPLDFRKDEKSGKKEKRSAGRSSGASAAYTLFTMGLLFSAVLILFSWSRYVKLQRQNGALREQSSELASILPVYDEYAAAYASYQRAESMYAATENRNEELVGFLEEMERKMPADVHVVSLTSTTESVTVNMNVGTKSEAALAIGQLRTFESLQADSVAVTSVVEETDAEAGSTLVNFVVTAIYSDMQDLSLAEDTEATTGRPDAEMAAESESTGE